MSAQFCWLWRLSSLALSAEGGRRCFWRPACCTSAASHALSSGALNAPGAGLSRVLRGLEGSAAHAGAHRHRGALQHSHRHLGGRPRAAHQPRLHVRHRCGHLEQPFTGHVWLIGTTSRNVRCQHKHIFGCIPPTQADELALSQHECSIAASMLCCCNFGFLQIRKRRPPVMSPCGLLGR